MAYFLGIELCGDELIALDAAFHGGRGILAIAGTGSHVVKIFIAVDSLRKRHIPFAVGDPAEGAAIYWARNFAAPKDVVMQMTAPSSSIWIG